MVTIVDCGISNTGSIVNMLARCDVDSEVTADAGDIARAERLILPGVGAFDHGMRRLREAGLIDALTSKALEERVPVLGICLGMQLITRRSEEGVEQGLGWLAAETVRFRFNGIEPRPKIPHMGWNVVARNENATGWEAVSESARFYYVHSFHVVCDDTEDVFAYTSHGYEFASVVRHKNVRGVQFHPEKSHRFGMAVLHEFATS